MPARIAVIGSNMVDLITYVDRMPKRGETIEAPTFAMGCGGKGANQAVAAAKLGAEVMMVSKVGDDLFGDNTIRNFQKFGIDTRHVEKVAGTSSGVAPIFVEPSGENSILIVKGANEKLSPADIDGAADDLAKCDLILLQLEVPLETVYHAIAFGAQHGIETVLNSAPATPDLDPGRLADLTFLIPNETELATLSGMPTASDAEVELAARAMIARGIRTVIVTLGSRGALLVTGGRVNKIPSIRVTPKDTTGAGDAFIGSFAAQYADSRSVEQALQRAVRYAALSITKPGTQSSYASNEEFEAFLGAVDAENAT